MSEVETEQVEWLLKPFLPFGKITLVQGNPGEGKTNLMLAIATDLTQGRELPDGSIHAPSAVIFQTAEDGLADTIKPRLESFGADCCRVHDRYGKFIVAENSENSNITINFYERELLSLLKLLIMKNAMSSSPTANYFSEVYRNKKLS